jgi:phosphoribosylaminoimidazole carboxylase (NCAIR synthetase)
MDARFNKDVAKHLKIRSLRDVDGKLVGYDVLSHRFIEILDREWVPATLEHYSKVLSCPPTVLRRIAGNLEYNGVLTFERYGLKLVPVLTVPTMVENVYVELDENGNIVSSQ